MVKARYDAGLLFFNSSKWQLAQLAFSSWLANTPVGSQPRYHLRFLLIVWRITWDGLYLCFYLIETISIRFCRLIIYNNFI